MPLRWSFRIGMTNPYQSPRSTLAARQRPDVRSRRFPTQRLVARFVSTMIWITAGLGILYCPSSIAAVVSRGIGAGASDVVATAGYWTMTLASGSFCVSLIFWAVRLWTGRPGAAQVVIRLFLAEVAYLFAVASICLAPEIARSIGPLVGVANGGLMAQFGILLPLWAPLLLLAFRIHEIPEPVQVR